MLKLLETLKDSAEAAFDSATTHVENTHRLIGGYMSTTPRGRAAGQAVDEQAPTARLTIYDVIRGVNREVGEFGTDVFEIIEDARARYRADRDR